MSSCQKRRRTGYMGGSPLARACHPRALRSTATARQACARGQACLGEKAFQTQRTIAHAIAFPDPDAAARYRVVLHPCACDHVLADQFPGVEPATAIRGANLVRA